MGVAAARIMGGNGDRREDDFYPTPADVTISLLERWRPREAKVWEPCCGDGAIVRVLEGFGYNVVATDLIDRGLGGGRDFLREPTLAAPAIVTNPPFKLASEIIERAHQLCVREMALYLKSTFWHAACRRPLFERYRPALILPLSWRPDFSGEGGPTMESMWCVWSGHTDQTVYEPLPRIREMRGGLLNLMEGAA
jgi:hypothetical protein